MTDIHCKAPILPRCCRCGRTLRNPALIGGAVYGSTCARSAGSVAVRHVKVTPSHETTDLLTGIDLDGAVLVARESVRQTIDASAARHVAEMRAGWGRAQ